MGLDQSIDITAGQRNTVLALLKRYLPHTTAWVYGSRAKWTARPQSDLDLVVFATPEQHRLVSDLREKFEGSNLPFRVDLFVWDTVPEQFRKRIEAEHVVLAPADVDPFDGRSSDVAGEWPTDRFERLLTEPVRNGIYKRKEFHGRGAKIVNMGELFAHPRLHAVPMKRVELSKSEADRFLIATGDLLFARRSLVAEGAGKCCVVLNVDEPTTFESSIIRARPDSTKANYLYLYYFFNSALGLYHLDTIRRQVAVAGITGSDLAKLTIPVPFLPEQRDIAHILGTLDDKIELNQRMNTTLEALARALFTSWFVDFDPVRAKMEGRDTGLPKHIADLFPDRLVESELGEMPEGWETGLLGDVAEQPRRSVPPWKIAPRTPYIALEHMPKNRIALSAWGNGNGLASNKFAFKQGEILFGKLRPYFHKVGVAPVNGVCSTDIVVVAPRAPQWFGLVVGHVSSADFIHYTDAGSTGTKMPRTSWTDMALYELVLPPEPLAAAFTEMVQPAIDRIITQIHESRGLVALRDTLLPKLVSGELRAKQIEPESSISNISPDATGVQA